MATSKNKTSVNYFSQYKANKTWEVNRKRKLAKVLKDQPNNQQVKDAMSGMVYRRKTPTTRQWSASAKRIAQMYKKVTGVFHKDILSNDPKLQLAATKIQQANRQVASVVNTMQFPSFFALGNRLQGIR